MQDHVFEIERFTARSGATLESEARLSRFTVS